jgi:hypothetical protein
MSMGEKWVCNTGIIWHFLSWQTKLNVHSSRTISLWYFRSSISWTRIIKVIFKFIIIKKFVFFLFPFLYHRPAFYQTWLWVTWWLSYKEHLTSCPFRAPRFTPLFGRSMLLIFLIFCFVCVVCFCLSLLCVLCPMLHVPMDCPFGFL